MQDLILRVDGVSKEYRLGVYGGRTLREDLQSWWANRRGADDPNRKIGAAPRKPSGERLMALSDVSFDIQRGETLGIIGRNGAGKSTLLKLISGVTAPTSGTICLNGRITSMLEVGTGFHKELTGRENVYLNGAILGMAKAEIKKHFDEIVEFSEVGKFIDTPVKRYSSGMYVKLAFSVAAHLESEIVIMDEVLAVGDVDFQNKCIKKMKEVSSNEGRTILYVSHNMNTIRQLCRRCIVLEKGRLVFEGGIEDSISTYLGTLKLSYAVSYDTGICKRTDNSLNIINISHIELLNKEINIYETKEKISVLCHLNAKMDCTNVRFMLIVFDKTGTRLGMSESNNFRINKGDSEVEFCFMPDVLPDGSYYVELNIVERNSLGGYDKYEGIIDAFAFHVENSEHLVTGKDWNASVWGNAFYNPIEVVANNE